MATNPGMDLADVSDEVGVSVSTLKNWKKEPGVGEGMYETYISSLGGEIPAVISSMVREAKLGNVQAARLVLEAGGKLVKRISVKVSSPYDQFLKTKDLVGIPWRVAIALVEDGWYLRNDIIWHKPNPMPEAVRDRCAKSHEHIFLLTKKPK